MVAFKDPWLSVLDPIPRPLLKRYADRMKPLEQPLGQRFVLVARFWRSFYQEMKGYDPPRMGYMSMYGQFIARNFEMCLKSKGP